LASIRAFFIFSAAVYYVMVASGRTLLDRTGNYLPVDCIHAFIVIPFRNFINQYVSFSFLRKGEKNFRGLSIVTGIILAAVLAAILIPMLERADSGGFGIVLKFLSDILTFEVIDFLFYAFFAIPIAAYIYGLVSGTAHGRYTGTIKQGSAQEKVAALRFAPTATIFIVLGTICAIYLVFIFSQVPYFFSAFTGRRPDGWLVYAEYARQGFFELCGIAAINLAVLTVSNLISKKQRVDSRLLKAFNIILALITLALIATAFSKMVLYINAYGLTMRRLLPCVFMVFLAVVFIALIALQKWNFSIVRTALVTGAILICTLSLSNPDALVIRYNTGRYISGTLHGYDVDLLYRAGAAGVSPAIDVYHRTDDFVLKRRITQYLESQVPRVSEDYHKMNLETFLAQNRLAAEGFTQP